MSLAFYKGLHLVGLMWLFASLGAGLAIAIQGVPNAENRARKLVAASHGVALLLVLIAGFGMHAKLQLEGMPTWFLAKLGLWAVVGALIALPSRRPELAKPAWFALPVLAAIGAWLGLAHG
jgi:hypothetical protein